MGAARSWFGGMVIVAFLVGGVYSVLSLVPSRTHRSGSNRFWGPAAYGACIEFVTDSFETPATAIFAGRFASVTRIEDLSDSWSKYVRPVYQVDSYVDA